ncbi:MAG TPA: SHOCT domain-containing protein [Verrucomicrobiae bacterium]|nr:SHOCT domain-containing protein [Verrucomicrobiae bacterium]
MKKTFIFGLRMVLVTSLFSGCMGLGLQLGGGSKSFTQAPTLGQQLTDLHKAKETGALTDAEYQAQKAKLLENK